MSHRFGSDGKCAGCGEHIYYAGVGCGPDARKTREEILEDFEFTRPEHKGGITLAASILKMNRESLARALHRAKAGGVHVEFHETKGDT